MKVKNQRVTDLTEVRVIAIYMIQKLTHPTLEELHESIKKKLHCTIHKSTLKQALRGAQKAGFITTAMIPREDGRSVHAWSMKNLSWSNPPEYAHIKDLIPILMRSPMAMKIKNHFDGQEGEAKTTKKKKGNLIDNFHAFRVTAITLDPLLGSQIECEYTNQVRADFPSDIEKNKVEVQGIWHRDELTGEFIITSDVLQGWFKTNACRYAGLQDSKAAYVAFNPVRIRPKKPVYQLVLPVNTARGASAPKPYETISAGEEITIDFVAPTKGVLSSEEYERIFVVAGLRPRRGLSPARGTRFGRFLVTSFEDLGPVQGKGSLAQLDAVVPDVLMEEHGDYLRDAMKRLGLRKAKPSDTVIDDDAGVPPWDAQADAAE